MPLAARTHALERPALGGPRCAQLAPRPAGLGRHLAVARVELERPPERLGGLLCPAVPGARRRPAPPRPCPAPRPSARRRPPARPRATPRSPPPVLEELRISTDAAALELSLPARAVHV